MTDRGDEAGVRTVPLSGGQRALWFLYLRHAALAGYFNLCLTARIEPGIDAARLRPILDELARRHATLRVSFVNRGDELVQQVRAHASIPLQVVDVQGMDEACIAQLIEVERNTPFDTAVAVRARVTLYRAGPAFSVMLVTVDHMISDGWSGFRIGEQICEMLKAGAGAVHAHGWQPVPQFFEHVAEQQRWLASAAAEQQLEYWRQELAHAGAALDLAHERNQPEQRAFVKVMLDAELVGQLRALAKRHGVSMYVLLLAPYLVLLQRLSGQSQLAVGVPIPGRSKQWHETLGFLGNTAVLRAELTPALRMAELLKQLRGTLRRALKHQSYPYAELVQRLRPLRDDPDHPFFQVWFNHHNARLDSELGAEVVKLIMADPSARLECGDLLLRSFGDRRVSGGPGVDLLLDTVELGEQIRADLNYHAGRFERATIERYLAYWQQLLRSMVAAEDAPVDALSMLSRSELLQLTHTAAARASFPRELCLHELFEQQAACTPDNIAIECGAQRLTYRELNERANRLAHYLRARGVKPESRVALAIERGIDMVLAILAVLKAGGAYVPLDPAYPPERSSFMLGDCTPCALLVDATSHALLPQCPAGLPVIDVRQTQAWSQQPANNPGTAAVGLAAHHLAYVIYTSGSTGTPKGVMIEHRNVTRLFAAAATEFDFKASDAWSLFHSYAFDFSVWEIWGALLHGARLVVVPLAIARAPQQFHELLCRAGITVLNQTPSAFRQLIDAQRHSHAQHDLRYVIFGGEALDETTLAPWYAQQRNHATQLVNMYGITETTVHVTYRALASHDAAQRSGSIGAALADLGIHVLDAQGAPVPVGMPGEIHVTGAGVARGYLNRAELTAQRFLPDPFSGAPDARMYRTGDVGRRRVDGTIQYLGRNDDQVKIRGFRIELGEIEAQLRRHPLVTEAVVLAHDDTVGKRLVAYYVGANCTAETLRAHAAAGLPHYMVPAGYVQLPVLPLTANGKLDRRALAALDDAASVAREYHAPQGDVEAMLAALWQQLLHVERVGRFDHFFELGGHSMLAVRLINGLRERGYHLDVLSLFAQPTLSALAQQVQPVVALQVAANLIPAQCATITPEMLPLVPLSQADIDRIVASIPGGAANVQDIYPLTPLQAGMLFHTLQAREDVYVLRTLMHVDTHAQLQRLLAVLDAMVARHDILRTAVLYEGLAEPVQVVVRHASLTVDEVQLDPAGGSYDQQLLELFAGQRLDVRCAPMQRVHVARDASGPGWLLLLVSHHLIGDHSTLRQMLAELDAALRGVVQPQSTAMSFRNFVAHSRRTDAAAEEALFRRMLASIEEPTRPFGLEESAASERSVQRASTVVDTQLGQRLRLRARELGVSAASLFHVAWAQVVARTAQRTQVVFGTVLVGRMQGGAGTGMFINTLPIRIDIDDCAVAERARSAHAMLAELLQHEHASLVLAQRCSSVPAALPLFTSLLNYRHAPASDVDALRAHGIEVLWQEERTNYPLTLLVDDRGDHFELTSLVQGPVAPQRVCELMTTALARLAEALEHAPATPIGRIDVLPDSERRLLTAWSMPRARHDSERCVHESFEAQVQRTPQAVAVEFEGAQLTYAELNRQANAWAHRLRALGVGPGSLVALCVQRSFGTVVSVLAVLKAGGAYVPLDPAYPLERLQFMLADSSPQVLMVDAASRPLLAQIVPQTQAALHIVDIDALEQCAGQSFENPSARGLSARRLAYVIYTSGSTGTPKGVMVEHANLTRLLAATEAGFDFRATDVWTLFHSYAFDFSVWELWGPLTRGARLIVVPLETARSAVRFHRLVCRRGVTVLNQTPSAFRPFITAQAEYPQRHQLRYVIFGGEALDATTLRPWYEQRLNQDVQLVNMYGITETTVHVTYKALTPADAAQATVSVGRAIADLAIHILDPQGRPAPIDVAGEIYVGGAGVTRGYLNRAELTEQRFVADPFSGESGARLYRSGDLGRWRASGEIDYLGRNDAQVKIRGFRIELGEIEAQLRACGGVEDAVVVARLEADGERRLVGYFTRAQVAALSAQQLGVTLTAQHLKEQLSARLPAHMVPVALVELEELPLTSNGKLDRDALPAPQRAALATEQYERPQSEVELAVAQVWKEVLHLDQVSRNDDFFELGGNSLLAMRLSARIRQVLGREPRLDEWLRSPTLARLAEQLEQVGEVERLELENLVPDREREHEPFALTPIQLAYWLGRKEGFELGNVGAHMYVEMPVVAVDVARFEQTLNYLIARHGMLRMVVTEQGKQRILPKVPRYSVQVNDWREAAAPQAQQRFEAVRRELSHQVFSGKQWPLFDFRISLLADRAVIHASLDALMLDGSSALILREELLARYADPRRELAPLQLSFRDYVLARQRLEQGALHQRARRYWLDRMADFPAAPDLPLALDPAQITTPRFERRRHTVSAQHWQALLAIAQRQQVTPTALFLSCFGEVLSRWTRQPRFVLNLTLFNRLPLHPQVDRVLGDFSTLTLLEMDFGTPLSLAERLRATQQQLWRDLEQRYCDGIEVMQALRQVRDDPVRYPVVVTSMLGVPQPKVAEVPEGALRSAGEEYSITQTSQVWLDVQVIEQAGALVYNWDSVVGLFPEGMLDAMFATFNSLFEQLVDAACNWEQALQIAPPSCELQLMAAANATARDFPRGLLHAPMLAQIAARPDQVAVRGADRTLTYGELGRRTAWLACELAQGGARPNQPIAIVMEKGWQQIVAVLGILRAGAAYLPIDASWPRERIALLLQSVAIEQVITTREHEACVPAHYRRYLVTNELRSGEPAELPLRAQPQDLAYVIFTSGSTGIPKGVMIEHGAALNTVLDINERFQVCSRDSVLGLSSLSFDLSVYDIFGVLGAGGTLVLPSAAEQRDPSTWLRYLQGDAVNNPVTLWNTVPALLQMLTDWLDGSAHRLELRVVLLSGDWVAVDLPQRVRARAPHARVISLGGATEASIWSIVYPIDVVGDDWRSIPYGKALANQQFHVLQADLTPAPVWVPGELYIGGVGLARGYFGDEQKTARSFIRHPRTGERLYRTGDHGRWLPDGNIEFLGRQDEQVKVQGYRIELGEIEARLKSHAAIRDAVVTVQRRDRVSRLTAYAVGKAPHADSAEATEEVLEYLRRALPEYMVPQHILWLPSMPLTANGKLDRKALPVPEMPAAASTYESPQGEIEAALAQIWQELLQVDRIGRHDNFFQLGGGSLLAIKSVTRVRQVLGIEVPVRAVFTSPTVNALAKQVEGLWPQSTPAAEDEAYETGYI